eukprot:9202227-Heterocapsa_arctica.AAC.1
MEERGVSLSPGEREGFRELTGLRAFAPPGLGGSKPGGGVKGNLDCPLVLRTRATQGACSHPLAPASTLLSIEGAAVSACA